MTAEQCNSAVVICRSCQHDWIIYLWGTYNGRILHYDKFKDDDYFVLLDCERQICQKCGSNQLQVTQLSMDKGVAQ